MGLFSNKKKVSVRTTVVPMADESLLPQSVKQAVVKSIFHTGDLTGEISDALLSGTHNKARRMRDYAAKHYPLGLPEARMGSSVEKRTIVEGIIQNQIGYPVSTTYYRMHPLSLIHLAWDKITSELGYEAESNELKVLSSQLGDKTYLFDIKAYLPSKEYEEAQTAELQTFGPKATEGYSPSRKGQYVAGVSSFVHGTDVILDPMATKPRIEIHYEFERVTTQVVGTQTFTYRNTYSGTKVLTDLVYDTEADYFQVRYTYQVPIPNTRPQEYKKHTGFWTYNEEGEDYPELMESFVDDLPTMGSHYPLIYFVWNFEGLTTREHWDDEMFKHSSHMMSMLGADYETIGTSIHQGGGEDVISSFMLMGVRLKGESEAEYDYLYNYFHRLYYTTPTTADSESGVNRGVEFKDARFKMALAYKEITLHRLFGKVAKTKRYNGGFNSEDGYFYYQYQNSASSYIEIRVYGASNTYNVLGKYSTVVNQLMDNILVPLDHSVMDNVGLLRKEELVLRSMHVVVNTYIEEVTKWYQTGAFKVIMAIVMLVITIFTSGAAAGLASAWQIGASAFVLAVGQLILNFGLRSLIMQVAFTVAAKVLGPEFAMLVAVVAAVYAMSGNVNVGPLTAMDIGKASLNLINAASKQYMMSKQVNLMKEIQEFTELKDAKDKELEKAMNELSPSNLIEPLDLIGFQPFILFGETPEALYSRTVHSGNTSPLAISSVTNYVENALRLPEPYEAYV